MNWPWTKMERRQDKNLREVLSCMQDVSEKSLIFYKDLVKNQKILEIAYHQEKEKARTCSGIVSASEMLLDNQVSFDVQLKAALDVIITSTQADKTWVFRKKGDDVFLLTQSQVVGADAVAVSQTSLLHHPAAYEHMRNGTPLFYNEDNFPENVRAIFPTNIQAACFLPLFQTRKKHSSLWGLMGMSFYNKNMSWTDKEKELMSSFCNIITSCIELRGV